MSKGPSKREEKLVDLYEAWGKPEQGAEWRAKLPSTERPAASQPVPKAEDTTTPLASQPWADDNAGDTEP